MSPVLIPAQRGKLRIRTDRMGLYATALAAIGAAMAICEWIGTRGSADWGVFRTAASIVGTRALLGPGQMNPFVYLPAFAWAYVPFASLPELAGTIINALVTLCVAAIAAYLAARIYKLPFSLSFLFVFAWAPLWSIIVLGQNAAIGLLFALFAILGGVEDLLWVEGVAIGALLYKPQYALPFLVFIILQRQWRTLSIVAGCAAAWYLASVAATGYDWTWPVRWLSIVLDYAGLDAAHNAPFAVGLPTLLYRFGLSEHLTIVLGLVLMIVGIWRLLGRPSCEAWSILPLIGLATSAHAWAYDAVLALPALFWTATNVSEPARTRIIIVAYAFAPFWLFSPIFKFDTLTFIVIGGTLLYFLVPPKKEHHAADGNDR